MTRGPDDDEPVPDQLTWWDTTWRIGAALLLGVTFWIFTIALLYPLSQELPEDLTFRGFWLVLVDPILGLAAVALLPLRRRWPMVITGVTTLLTAVSAVAAGAQTIALVSLSTRQRWREIAPMAALTVGAGLVAARLVYPDPAPLPLWAEVLVSALVIAVMVAVGYSIGSRRALVRSWFDRARTAEAGQRARVSQAQATERARIAREMHDVLAHRISLVTMHSGVLAYREDLPEDERRAAVRAIDTNARAALTDLREVLGVLRDPEGTDPLRPQSTLADLPDLLEEARSAGTRVTLLDGGLDLATVPETTGRTAYRVIQEGLTNARKHADGTAVEVILAGEPGHELIVRMSNPRAFGTAGSAAAPASGLGLLGLTERVELAGGRLEHGWTPDEHHRLTAWLPWSA